MFNNDGDESLDIPPPVTLLPPLPNIEPGMTASDKFRGGVGRVRRITGSDAHVRGHGVRRPRPGRAPTAGRFRIRGVSGLTRAGGQKCGGRLVVRG